MISHSGLTPTRKFLLLAPAAAALCYPFLLGGFHAVLSRPDSGPFAGPAWAAPFLVAAFAVPMFGFLCALRLSRTTPRTRFELRALRVSYLSVAAPPLFVFTGVVLGLLRFPLSDESIWIALWLSSATVAWAGGDQISVPPTASVARFRVAHGIAAAFIACFVLFHLSNHLLGWLGPESHAAVMEIGRRVYRLPAVELLLVMLLLFQVASGARLAWHWSAGAADAYRVFQVGSGAYLAAFIVTHLNSALVSARTVHGIETDWAWASGAPVGLIHDAWNIRLLPHYALGVFFVLGHLSSGLRQVLLTHGVGRRTANRIWAAGLGAGALVSTAIVLALCGARV